MTALPFLVKAANPVGFALTPFAPEAMPIVPGSHPQLCRDSNSVTALPVASARENARRSVISMAATGSPYNANACLVSPISGARKGHADKTKTALAPAAFTIRTAFSAAAISKADGRQGITTRLEARAILPASGAACGAASMTARSMLSDRAASRTRSNSDTLAVATTGVVDSVRFPRPLLTAVGRYR